MTTSLEKPSRRQALASEHLSRFLSRFFLVCCLLGLLLTHGSGSGGAGGTKLSPLLVALILEIAPILPMRSTSLTKSPLFWDDGCQLLPISLRAGLSISQDHIGVAQARLCESFQWPHPLLYVPPSRTARIHSLELLAVGVLSTPKHGSQHRNNAQFKSPHTWLPLCRCSECTRFESKCYYPDWSNGHDTNGIIPLICFYSYSTYYNNLFSN
jgi:hypothetical protein